MKAHPAAALALLALSLAVAPLAHAAELSRDQYVQRVEPICKKSTEANAQTLKGVRRQVQQGQLKQAGVRFATAAAALRQAGVKLNAVPKPSADQATLTRWLGYIGEEAKLLAETATKLRHEDKRGALRMSVLLVNTANRANATVLDFGFRYCRSNPSQFS
jgi:hypothetical protein